MLCGLHHVQLAMPEGGEDSARTFYQDVLGIPERPKPDALRKRGGCWFERGSLRVHLGVDPDFKPAHKAHPGFQAANFEDLKAALIDAGHAITNGDRVDGHQRFFVDDPFGNRVEILDAER